jgi:hypothetical protein
MIQIRNVPDALHRKLKARAAHEGKSLSDYLLDEMARLAELPTIDEWVERLHSRAPVRLTRSTAEWVREDRDSH